MAKRKQSRDYPVGYGKPPKHTRFQPGQSGNPKGRPEGVRNFKTDLREVLKRPITVTDHGRKRKMSTQMASLMRLSEQALSGHFKGLELLITLARLYDDEELSDAVDALSASDRELLLTHGRRLLRQLGAETGDSPNEHHPPKETNDDDQ